VLTNKQTHPQTDTDKQTLLKTAHLGRYAIARRVVNIGYSSLSSEQLACTPYSRTRTRHYRQL